MTKRTLSSFYRKSRKIHLVAKKKTNGLGNANGLGGEQ